MTEKLYYKNPYLKECKAEIVEVIKDKGKTLIVLDKTPFYPEGGGQPSDKGYIDGTKVIHVYEKNNTIYHEVEKEIQYGEVNCNVDFEKRFDFMQQHSGEHLLSGAVHKLFKGTNKGFHMGDDYSTMDIDIHPFTADMIEKIEREVNNYIYINQPFNAYIVNKEDLEKVPVRKKIDVEGDIRIVEAKGMDCCPCCGVHVLTTGQIGIIKIIKVEKYKGMSRLYFKCGKRAYEDFKVKHDIITSLTKTFSTNDTSLINNINKQCSEIADMKKDIKDLRITLSQIEASKLLEKYKDSEKTFIYKSYKDKSFEEVKYIGEALCKNECIVLLTSLKDKNILFINNSSSTTLSCGSIFKEYIKEYNGKGGGNNNKAQGSFKNTEDLNSFYEMLYKKISSYFNL